MLTLLTSADYSTPNAPRHLPRRRARHDQIFLRAWLAGVPPEQGLLGALRSHGSRFCLGRWRRRASNLAFNSWQNHGHARARGKFNADRRYQALCPQPAAYFLHPCAPDLHTHRRHPALQVPQDPPRAAPAHSQRMLCAPGRPRADQGRHRDGQERVAVPAARQHERADDQHSIWRV